jgi:ABC-2 type transport system permease protein
MQTILKHSFLTSRGAVLGWGLGLALYAVFIMAFYSTIMESREVFERLIETYPPELLVFFGGTIDFFTTAGFLHVYFFSYMPLVIGIYAVLAGSGLLVGEEESGVLDLLLAHPISRTALFWGRVLALALSSLAILLIAFLGFTVMLPTSGLEISLGVLALPFITLFAYILFFGLLALLLSFLLPSRRSAAMTAGMLMVASYLVSSMAELDETIEAIARFSPTTYFQGGKAVEGLEVTWLLGLLAFALLFTLLAWLLFERRDIRVGGESGWRLPWRAKGRPVPAREEQQPLA